MASEAPTNHSKKHNLSIYHQIKALKKAQDQFPRTPIRSRGEANADQLQLATQTIQNKNDSPQNTSDRQASTERQQEHADDIYHTRKQSLHEAMGNRADLGSIDDSRVAHRLQTNALHLNTLLTDRKTRDDLVSAGIIKRPSVTHALQANATPKQRMPLNELILRGIHAGLEDQMKEKISDELNEAQNRAKEISDQRLVAETDASKKRKDADRLSGDVEHDTKAIDETTLSRASKLASGKSELEAAKKAVSNINQEQLNEIKALKEPPKLVDMTMRAVATLMCIDVQEMLASNDFIPSILKFTYDTNKATTEHQKKIKKEFLSNHDFTFERVNSECKVCGPLVKWVRSQVRMVGLLFHVGPLTQEIKELKDTVVDKQKQADALHATVKELEAKSEGYKEEYQRIVGRITELKNGMAIMAVPTQTEAQPQPVDADITQTEVILNLEEEFAWMLKEKPLKEMILNLEDALARRDDKARDMEIKLSAENTTMARNHKLLQNKLRHSGDQISRLEYDLGETRLSMFKLKRELSHTLGMHESSDDPYELTQLFARLQHQIAEERMDNMKQSTNSVQLKDNLDKINHQLADKRIELKEQCEENDRLKLENERLTAESEAQGLERQRQKQREDEEHLRQLEHDYGANEQVIEAQMKLFEAAQMEINGEMEQNAENKYKALCMFTSDDVALKIKWWRYNDVDYRHHLRQTMRVFSDRALHGNKVRGLACDYIKLIVEPELKVFMTDSTMNIMFDCFETWRRENEDNIMRKPAAEIGYMLYHYPLGRLIDFIRTESIDGNAFIERVCRVKPKEEFIKEKTGWKQMEIYQIESVLFQHQCMNQAEFEKNLDSVLMNDELPNSIKDSIRDSMMSFDMVTIHARVRHGLNNAEFDEQMVNMVDALFETNEKNKANDFVDDFGDDFVQKAYALIAECLIWNKDSDNVAVTGAALRRYDWTCFNCSNRNFCAMVDGQRNTDLSVCRLCGISHSYSIILEIRNGDTFLMAHQPNEEDTVTTSAHADDIDTLIQSTIRDNKFNLECPNETTNRQCPAMIRLCHCLIQYKRWLYTMSGTANKKLHKPIEVDLAQIDDETFRNVFIQSAEALPKLQKSHVDAIVQMMQDNDTYCTDAFLQMPKKTFCTQLKPLGIKMGLGATLHKEIKNALQIKARQIEFGPEFGAFLSSCIKSVQKDYHHVLRSHIHSDNQELIKNAFSFFSKTVHYDDTESEIKNCKSCQRRVLRAQRRVSEDINPTTDDTKEEINTLKDTDSWTLNQYHTQSQLDIIHSYLVHFDWKAFIANKRDETDTDIATTKQQNENEFMNTLHNNEKYVTEYGFGVGHEYCYLSPKYNSIRAETLWNTMQCISDGCFQDLLVKAIHLHGIALGKEYEDELYCKYFNLEYNIIRNEPIGIRHVVAIVMYTDLSKFCTAFRSTYRKLDHEVDERQVTQRHRELYYYSRSMFEAIEFFGSMMHSQMKVYHGLSSVMHFDQFSAFFHQPISTTTDYAVALRFSRGYGIILTLKSGGIAENDPRKIPKYLSVSWLSAFPNEDERLFYGAYVVFKITNIHNISDQTQHFTSHSGELLMLNQFQKAIQNEDVVWNDDVMCQMLAKLIELHCNTTDSAEEEATADDCKSEVISTYGHSLFKHFCGNVTWICIRDFRVLPPKLLRAMFTNKDNKLSMMRILKLFPRIKEIVLNNIELDQMIKDGDCYIDMASEHVMFSSDDRYGKYLKRISFKSKRREDEKPISVFQRLENIYSKSFKEFQWSLEYQFEIENTHNLIFINDVIVTADKIKKLRQNLKELQRLQKDMKKEREVHRNERTKSEIQVKQFKQELKEKDELISTEREQREEILKKKQKEISHLKGMQSQHEDIIAKLRSDDATHQKRKKKKPKEKKGKDKKKSKTSTNSSKKPKPKKTNPKKKNRTGTVIEHPLNVKIRRKLPRMSAAEAKAMTGNAHHNEHQTKHKKRTRFKDDKRSRSSKDRSIPKKSSSTKQTRASFSSIRRRERLRKSKNQMETMKQRTTKSGGDDSKRISIQKALEEREQLNDVMIRNKLEAEQKRIAKQAIERNELLKSKQDLEFKNEEITKLNESLEAERVAMRTEIEKLSFMRKDVESKQNQKQAELASQRAALEAETKRISQESNDTIQKLRSDLALLTRMMDAVKRERDAARQMMDAVEKEVLKESLETERRAMVTQIQRLSFMRKDVLSKQKQGQAELPRQ
eukprot:786114_1